MVGSVESWKLLEGRLPWDTDPSSLSTGSCAVNCGSAWGQESSLTELVTESRTLGPRV